MVLGLGVLCLFFSASAQSRELGGRLGLGYNSQFANAYSNGARYPGISVKYGLSSEMAVEGVFSIATTSPTNSATGLKVFRNLFLETNLNFYSMLGAGFLSINGQSGFELLGGFGVEFFIPGLESLGFSMETGMSFDNGSGNYALKTLGISFLDAGIHFYF